MRKPSSFYFFKSKPIILKSRYERWRGVAELSGFKTRERLRVEWMVFYGFICIWLIKNKLVKYRHRKRQGA